MIDSRLMGSDRGVENSGRMLRLTFFFLQSGPLADGWNRRNPTILRDVTSELARCGSSPSLRGDKRHPPSASSPYVDTSLRPECANTGHSLSAWRKGQVDLKAPSHPLLGLAFFAGSLPIG